MSKQTTEQPPASQQPAGPATVDPNWVPSINRLFRLQWEEAQGCYVLLYPEGMVKLNGGAGEILSRCDGNNSVATLTEDLTRCFPDAEDIAEDIEAFLIEARQKGWLNHD